MRILHIIGSLDESAGGPSRSVPQTCNELAGLGISIELITRPSDTLIEIKKTSGLKLTLFSLKQLSKFANSLTKDSCDLIHLQHIWTPYIHVMARASRKAGIPYLITPRGMLEPWIMNRHHWKKVLAMTLYQRRDIRQASALHATCEMEKNNIRSLGFNNPIEIIPNGLDLSKVPTERTEFGSRKIVFLSRIHPKKGIELLLEAWKRLNRRGWRLDIAGDGDPAYITQLEETIKNEKIEGVQYVGPQYETDKWRFLKSGDLFILPSYSENFGIVVAEALATGIPVITTTGTPWQELQTNNCGWWIDLSVDQLVTTLDEAMHTDPEQLHQMGQRGRRLIHEKYDIKVVAQKMGAFYHQVTEHK